MVLWDVDAQLVQGNQTKYGEKQRDQSRWQAKTKQTTPFGYERVYLPLCKVTDTPSDIQNNYHL